MSDKVCVLGHIFQHVIMQPAHVPVKARKARPDASDGDTLPYSVYVTFAGAPFLRRMIMRAISGNAGAADIVLAAYDPPPSEFALSRRLIYILDYFPKSFDKPEDMVLRVKPNDVYLARVYNYDLNSQTRQVITGNVGSPVLKPGMIENGTLSILVIYDSNLSSWEEYDPELLRYTIETARNVVIAIRKWGDNSLDEKYLRFITDDLKEKCIIITTADALRECGVKITLNGSLEQAVNEIVACLDESPIKSRFGHKCSHFVVVFREVLVIQVSKSENGIRCAVHCCPNFKRAIQAEESRYGRMPGRFSIMLTAIVKGLYDHNKKTPDEREDIFERIEMALRQGVAACASYFDKGYASKDGVAPFDALLEAVDFSGNKEKSGLMTLPGREFGISSVRASFGSQGLAGGRQWVRSDFFQENIGEIAKNIIKKGLDEALRDEGSRGRQGNVDDNSYPKATISCPYAEFGDYKTFDAEEAQDFYALENLLRKYLGTPDWEKPLSIAVFGKPGSGKNFFVNNIIKNVTKKEVKPLVFNLAQFREISQLTEAFHKIQDQGLTMDTPVVVFDEFDCKYDNSELGWLKFFLAPMQDGEFLGETALYHIRRAIFVFAGGNASTFQEFRETRTSKKEVKLADFISRLRGHLDVKDISDMQARRESRLLKRALLLRSLLEKHAKPILKKEAHEGTPSATWEEASIDDAIIDAFLSGFDYKHGSRSMEAVIQMCRWINGRFVPASLPPQAQLALHIEMSPRGSPGWLELMINALIRHYRRLRAFLTPNAPAPAANEGKDTRE